MKFLFIFLCIFLLLRLLFKPILRFVIQSVVNKMVNNQQAAFKTNTYYKSWPKGKSNVDYSATKPTSKPDASKAGEYVDFEEVK